MANSFRSFEMNLLILQNIEVASNKQTNNEVKIIESDKYACIDNYLP